MTTTYDKDFPQRDMVSLSFTVAVGERDFTGAVRARFRLHEALVAGEARHRIGPNVAHGIASANVRVGNARRLYTSQ